MTTETQRLAAKLREAEGRLAEARKTITELSDGLRERHQALVSFRARIRAILDRQRRRRWDDDLSTATLDFADRHGSKP